jgi:LPS export ABC transporter protein LptC
VSPRNITVTVLLTTAALGSWYLARQHSADDGLNAQAQAVNRGYYLKSARILGTAADGSLLYVIQASHAEQRNDTEIAFTDVHINYSPASDVPWVVNADAAIANQDGSILKLQGHVRAHSSEGFSGNDTEIRTDYLELDPERYVATTEERVQIRIGARSLTATGMLASLKENQVQLKSNVSGKFAP